MKLASDGTPSVSVRHGFRSLSPTARLLVINDFGINVGFFMVLPFLAAYLTDDLGYGAAVVGLVLGLRTLSQQGMFLLGGSAADRIGCRPMIIAGCSLRVVAFGLFAVFTSLPGVITATVLTGLSSALFNPALRTYLSHESGGRRAETFAVLGVAEHAGALVGPLLGGLLLMVNFQLVALVACAVFAVLTLAQIVMLPAHAVQRQERTVFSSWWDVVANRRFVAFALAGSVYFALYNQIYLALPLEAQRVTASTASISAVFVVSTVVGIAVQVRITAACRARWSSGTSLSVGLALMGGGFLPVMLTAPWLPTGVGADSLAAAAIAATPVLVGTIVYTVGGAIAFPFIMDLLPVVGSERLVGTYYGFFYLCSALVTAVVSWLVGGLIGLTDPALRWSPAAALIAIGLAGASGIAIMQRRGLLAPRLSDPDPPVR